MISKNNPILFNRRDASPKEWNDWKWQYHNRIRSISQLAKVLTESLETMRGWRTVIGYYPLNITPYYFSLINTGDKNDPIRLQCFPDVKEINYSQDGVADPLNEERDMPVSGLVQRYLDRCVTICTNDCAVYCRHCNRKRMWKRVRTKDNTNYLQRMVEYISQQSSIREVIVSGGDPLTMDESTLEWFLGRLHSLPHVEVLRVGSRVPVVMPMRITPQLCAMLRKHRPLWFNTQFNHPNEITPEAARACEMLLDAGIPVLNQSVLLRGVNDNYETMRELLYGLQKISVKPYYLFQCEQVKAAEHFRADIWSGIHIMEKLWKNISGICLPQYVLDMPGDKGKLPLFPFSLFSVKGLQSDEHFFDKRE
ncbi:MAG: KamA family radical SAM protein [Syntrophaceae bacterium]